MSADSVRPVHVAVTGAAGQVGYASLFRIASGGLLGPETPVVLRLLEIEPAMGALEGVVMELDDGAFPLLAGIEATSDPDVAFDGVSWALLLGAKPRQAGMERGDLLTANAGLFTPLGRSIGSHAADDVRVLVVGNPCNTNALLASQAAPDVPADRWFAMTRLDENRAKAQLAQRSGAPFGEVTNLTIWGNHSATQYPDAANAKIGGVPAPEVIKDADWLNGEFVKTVQTRGAAIIEARGLSSAGSAASAAIDTVHSLHEGTPDDDWTSVGVISRGEYGVPEGLVFSYPVAAKADGTWSVVEGLEHAPTAQERLDATIAELVTERDAVSSAAS